MNPFLRKIAPACLLGVCAAAGFGVAAWADGAAATRHARLIKVSARRFVFSPDHLTIKKGETVDIELSTADVLMGFSVPDLNARSDIPPGQVMHLKLTPDKVGTFVFLCDIFCGSGHENMSGSITVTE
ncbi:cupredoxin domain-containing protein [Nevskia soli]|uniref:cupredoxin domain-containing protein n=1 Tax=Nevskia soli TaxID=418856 RepID=UPI00055B4FDB|nr:cupredoxin domain-containing protein [Nevskia soli]